MIDFISGTLEELGDNYVIVENQGIGYKIFVPTSLFPHLPEVGEEVKLYTYLVIKEDILVLFGFLQRQQRELFSLLLTVSGIGQKVALTILSVISTDDFYLALINEDLKALTRIPGIGRKSAQRLILELKEKIPLPAAQSDKITSRSGSFPASVWFEVKEALLLLGYSHEEIAEVMKGLQRESISDSSPEELLKLALKRLSSAPGKEGRFC